MPSNSLWFVKKCEERCSPNNHRGPINPPCFLSGFLLPEPLIGQYQANMWELFSGTSKKNSTKPFDRIF